MKVRIMYHGIEIETEISETLPTSKSSGSNIEYMQTVDKVAIQLIQTSVNAIKDIMEARK